MKVVAIILVTLAATCYAAPRPQGDTSDVEVVSGGPRRVPSFGSGGPRRVPSFGSSGSSGPGGFNIFDDAFFGQQDPFYELESEITFLRRLLNSVLGRGGHGSRRRPVEEGVEVPAEEGDSPVIPEEGTVIVDTPTFARVPSYPGFGGFPFLRQGPAFVFTGFPQSEFDIGNLPDNYDNSTYTVTVENGTRTAVNETVYKDNDSGVIIHTQFIHVIPDQEPTPKAEIPVAPEEVPSAVTPEVAPEVVVDEEVPAEDAPADDDPVLNEVDSPVIKVSDPIQGEEIATEDEVSVDTEAYEDFDA